MLTLGIDTAGRQASVALIEDDQVLAYLSRCGSHSAVLLPMVAELLRARGRTLDPAELDLIGVSRGPGSYTGLRVGVITAKTMGWSSHRPVLGVPTLAARASQAPDECRRILVALHAYKRRMLFAWFVRDAVGAPLYAEGEPELIQADEVPRARSGEAVVTDAPELLAGLDVLGVEVVLPLEEAALAVARLARRRHTLGAADETWSLAPDYLKPPSVTLKPGLVRGAGCAEPPPHREAIP